MANGFADNLRRYLSDKTAGLPSLLTAASASQEIAEWLALQEGVTFNLYFGNRVGQSLYAVSLYPERSVVIPGHSITGDLLHRFIEDNLDLLTDPRNSLGVWYSDLLEAFYLDVSATLPDKSEALLLGQWYNQEAVYDLQRDEVIDTGGTGEQREGLLPEGERLSPWLHQIATRSDDE